MGLLWHKPLEKAKKMHLQITHYSDIAKGHQSSKVKSGKKLQEHPSAQQDPRGCSQSIFVFKIAPIKSQSSANLSKWLCLIQLASTSRRYRGSFGAAIRVKSTTGACVTLHQQHPISHGFVLSHCLWWKEAAAETIQNISTENSPSHSHLDSSRSSSFTLDGQIKFRVVGQQIYLLRSGERNYFSNNLVLLFSPISKPQGAHGLGKYH